MMSKDILILYLTSILAIGIADDHLIKDHCYSSPCFQEIIKNQDDAKNKLNQIITAMSTYPSSSLVHSCEEIKANWPDSPSDYYIIADSNEHARHVYCHMEELCDSKGGWMRVAYLNMSDSTEECPPGFRLYDENGVRACGRPVSSPSGYCQSVKFPSYSISYSQVCGRVTGYQ